MGTVLREQNALPTQAYLAIYSTAKDAIDNGVVGRAAKSENPSACAKTKNNPLRSSHRDFLDIIKD